MFTNRYGGPVAAKDLLSGSYRPLLEKAGVRRVRFHDLRHSVASILLGEGVQVKVVQELLGHSSPVTTLSIYSHVLPKDHHNAVNHLGEPITPADPAL